MSTTKVAITLEAETVREIDRWVREGRFPNRSRAIQAALTEMTARFSRRRLMDALAKVDRGVEKAIAEESFSGEVPWPEY
jgi:Arc/MetJ-type ribon-helix-helix transcriptional regulator